MDTNAVPAFKIKWTENRIRKMKIESEFQILNSSFVFVFVLTHANPSEMAKRCSA